MGHSLVNAAILGQSEPAARAVADIGASASGAGGAVDTRVVVLSEGWRARV